MCPPTPHLSFQMICPWPGRAPISGEPLLQGPYFGISLLSACQSLILPDQTWCDDSSTTAALSQNQVSNPILASPSPASPLLKGFSQSPPAHSLSPTCTPQLYFDHLHLSSSVRYRVPGPRGLFVLSWRQLKTACNCLCAAPCKGSLHLEIRNDIAGFFLIDVLVLC